jgi:two-component system OmpR family sensor kinase
LKAIFDTLAGRAIIVLLAGVLTVQFSSQWIYEATLANEAALANQERLVERLYSIYQNIGRLSSEARDTAAHDLSGGAIEAHWAMRPRAVGDAGEEWGELRRQLLQRLPPGGGGGVMVGKDGWDNSPLHLAMISMRLPDESWINVGILAPHFHPPRPWQAIAATTLVALVVMLASVLMVRWLARPLQRMADAARSFQLAGSSEIVPEGGPREIRALATAFNDMQSRILRQTRTRTQALAAVSHDLKTPLTRVRFRLEELKDRRLRRSLERDLSEMERMIEATLHYLKGDRAGEEAQPVELVALLRTISDDASDMGQDVMFHGPATLVLRGRRLALKRAITNIVQNAVKYGRRAEITASIDDDQAVVTVLDEGPGVPPDKIDALFEPFVRLETSRNEATGGFGLGLTIADEIIGAHDGTITLQNRPEVGLEVVIRLPLKGPAGNVLSHNRNAPTEQI